MTKTARDLMASYENEDLDTIIAALQRLDHEYFNDGEPELTDEEYDALKLFAKRLKPDHPYFKKVGSDVRGGKIPLPVPLGSLDQIEIGEITEWVGNWGLQKEDMIVTDKLDGASCLLVFDSNGFKQAFSRGNGIEGADITRHLRYINFPKTSIPWFADSKLMIRGEVIVSKANFPKIRKICKTQDGREYKNARNMVSGLMNREKIDGRAYKHIHFVAYDVIGSALGKEAMLEGLQLMGFRTPHTSCCEGRTLTDDYLAEYLTNRRQKTEYEIDGVVIDVDEPTKRHQMNPTRDTLNPAYSVKYKVADAANQATATVVDVEWRVSKHGYLKPRVVIEPTELVGVTITHATGFNAKFVDDNRIGPGARVQITRSGDVIPFIQKVVKPADEAAMPGDDGIDYFWNETGVDIMTFEHQREVDIEAFTAFFAGIDAPLLKKGNVTKMYDAGFDELCNIVCAKKRQLVEVLGSNGTKIYDGLRDRLTNIPFYTLAGSTNFFGRGIGRRKLKKLQQALGLERLQSQELTLEEISAVEGFNVKTARKVLDGLEDFWYFYEMCYNTEVDDSRAPAVSIAEDDGTSNGGTLIGEKVVFTGFRDKSLAAEVEAQGGTMQSSVSGKTTILVAKNPNSNSGKMKKARANGTKIMGIDEFKEMIS